MCVCVCVCVCVMRECYKHMLKMFLRVVLPLGGSSQERMPAITSLNMGATAVVLATMDAATTATAADTTTTTATTTTYYYYLLLLLYYYYYHHHHHHHYHYHHHHQASTWKRTNTTPRQKLQTGYALIAS